MASRSGWIRQAVVVVDDDPNDLMFIRAAFLAAGHLAPIHELSGGNEAVAYLEGEGRFSDRSRYAYPDLLITDLKMPQGDGFAVLEYLRTHPDRAVTPTVVLSDSQDQDDIRRAYLLGASAYHVKPGSPSELRGLVKAMCEYWNRSEIVVAGPGGNPIPTDASHKIGQRFT